MRPTPAFAGTTASAPLRTDLEAGPSVGAASRGTALVAYRRTVAAA